MTHPAIQAVLNQQEIMEARLARVGQTAILELLQPLFMSESPITGIFWFHGIDPANGEFFSSHQVPEVMVDRSHSAVEYDKGQYVDPKRVVGVLGSGWADPRQLIPATRKVMNEKLSDFFNIPNEVMRLTFGDSVSVTIERSGHIKLEQI